MTIRARVTFAAFLLVLAGLPLSFSLGQGHPPGGSQARAHLVSGLISTLCGVIGSCTPPKPVITSVMTFSNITPGGGVIVQGENFADANGNFGQFQLTLCSGESYKLEKLQWGDTFAAGTLPADLGKQVDSCGNLYVVRSDGATSNPIPVGFIATRDFAVLPSSDVTADCSSGGDDHNVCDYFAETSASGSHMTTYGHDMGTDHFTANLQNGWVFYDMDYGVVDARNGSVQPPAGFTGISNSVQLSVHWDQNGGPWTSPHGASTAYVIRLYIMGPKDVRWNGFP